MKITDNIKLLSNLHGVSGYEQTVADEVKKIFSQYCDECSIDAMGNVIGVKKSKNSQGKVMIEAHMDEVGLIITDIDDKGFLYFSTIGGIDARIILTQEVIVHGKSRLTGVIGAKPPHILSAEERKKTVPKDKLYIDTGFGADEIKKLVKVGDTATMKNKTLFMLDGMISTKAQDDRTSVAAIMDVLHQLKDTELPFDLYAVAAVQEEVGLRGAGCAAYNINPDFAIAIDVCHGTSPDAKDNTFPTGGGTVISKGPNIHPVLVEAVINVMKIKGIDYSIDIDGGDTGTDAAAIQIANSGVPTVLFSLPLKYMHTPIETVSEKDVQSTANAIAEFLKSVKRVGDVICY